MLLLSLPLLGACAKELMPTSWNALPISEHYSKGYNDLMFREFLNFGSIDFRRKSEINTVIQGAQNARYYFGFVLSTAEPLSEQAWQAIPNMHMRVELFDVTDQPVAKISFGLHDLTRRVSGRSADIYPSLPGPYQTFVYLDQVREAVWKLDPARTYRCHIVFDEVLSEPPNFELAAVALWPGSKQVTMEIPETK